MTNYSMIYSKLNGINRAERIILRVMGTLTDEEREYIEADRADAKREIRKALRNIKDPLEKSLLDGGKHGCSSDWYSYYEYWYEPDDPTMTDEEVAEYVDSEYGYSCRYPGGSFTRAYWERTSYGLRIITYNSMDI